MPANVPSADPPPQHGKSRQQGFALLIMLIVVVMGSLYAVTSQLEVATRKYARDEATFRTLALAKEALIGYAVGFALPTPGCSGDPNCNNRPGDLPCPDNHVLTDINAGTPTTPCNSNAIGRLPDKTLGISGLIDSNGERFWYAVSTNFKNSVQTGILNSSQQGTITVRDSSGSVVLYDATAGNGVVAVIIAPGAPLVRSGAASVQDRSLAWQTTTANYLDTNGSEDNATFADSSTDGFIMGPAYDAQRNVIVNDQIVTITRDEIMAAIGQRVAKEALICLNQFPAVGRSYPWPAPLITPVVTSTTGRTGTQFGRFPLNQEDVSLQAQVEAAINATQSARAALTTAAGTAGEAAALQKLADQLAYLQDTVYAAYNAIILVRDQASNTKNASTNVTTNTFANALLAAIRNTGFDAFLDETKTDYDDVVTKLAAFSANPTYTTADNLRTTEGNLRTLMRTTSYDSIITQHFPYTQNATIFAGITATYNDAVTARSNAGTARSAAPFSLPAEQPIIDNAVNSATTALATADTLMKTIGGYVLNTTAATIQEKAANALFAAEAFAALATKTDAAAANIDTALQALKTSLTALAPLPPATGALPTAVETPRTNALAATNTAITSVQLARTDLSIAANATAAVNNATTAFNQAATLAQAMQGQRVNIAASSVTSQADALHTYIVSLQSSYTDTAANAALSASTVFYRTGRLLVSANSSTTSASSSMRNAANTAIASLQIAIAALPTDPQLATKRTQAITDASALETAARTLATAILNNGDNVGLETLVYWNTSLAGNLGSTTRANAVRAEATKFYNQAQTFLNNSFLGASSTYTLASTAAASANAVSPTVATVLTQTDAAIASAANLIANNLNTATGETPGAIVWPKHAACDWIAASPPPPAANTGSSWQANEWQRWVFVQLNDLSVAGYLAVNGTGNYPLIVIAPGPLLGGKTGDSTDPAHYMENNNATGPQTKQYVTGGVSATFNDRIAY